MALNELVNRKPPTPWQLFIEDPLPCLARMLQAKRSNITAAQTTAPHSKNTIAVVCISDTHNTEPKIPPGDLLIHAGDLIQGGTVAEVQGQLDWLNGRPHTHKIVIAGNHDLILDNNKLQHGEDAAKLRWGSELGRGVAVPHSSALNRKRVLIMGSFTSMGNAPSTVTVKKNSEQISARCRQFWGVVSVVMYAKSHIGIRLSLIDHKRKHLEGPKAFDARLLKLRFQKANGGLS